MVFVQILLWVLVLFIKDSIQSVDSVNDNLNSVNCIELSMKCKNGELIKLEELCDGTIDCVDGSDETAEFCIHLKCPVFTHRCAYGACISKDLICNNEPDCADNSDEAPKVCGRTNSSYYNGDCLKNQFQCNSGECILIDNICDGHKDCKDASDETVNLCAGMYCPSYAFQCGYGACISGNDKCNGVQNCLDGSDEFLVLCENNLNVTTESQNEVDTGSISITETTTSISVPGELRCKTENRSDLIVLLLINNETVSKGGYVDEYQAITYRCQEPNHTLDNEITNYCIQGKWVLEHPNCKKHQNYCSADVITGITFTADCKYQGVTVSCKENIRPGTIVHITCSNAYKKSSKSFQEYIECNQYGEWNTTLFQCTPKCGIKSSRSDQIIPWHVTIHSRSSNVNDQLCGGIIIDEKLVLSAAHCFWNTKKQRPYNHRLFKIAIGKRNRYLTTNEEKKIKYHSLSAIFIPSSYQNSTIQYENDIAILILNDYIEFNSQTKPICVEWLKLNENSIASGRIGEIAAWNKSHTDLNDSKLKTIEVETVSNNDCVVWMNTRFGVTTADNQFCITSINNGVFCNEDSGSGFVIPYKINGIAKYFLWGILSYTNNNTNQCDQNEFMTITNIQYYSTIIQNYQLKFRIK